MKGSKIGCIRRAVVNTQGDFNEWLDKSNMRETSIVDIAEHILNNGCDSKDFNDKLKSYFIEHVNWYTLVLLPVIEFKVNTSDYDFIKDDWNTIFTNLFNDEKKYNSVVYAVNEFTDTEQISDNVFRLFNEYSDAKQDFNEVIQNFVEEFGGWDELRANYDIYDDDDFYFRVNDPVTGDFYEFKIEKVPIR